jgi:hypothetical protein
MARARLARGGARAARAFGGGAGYAVILLAVTAGLWRLDRWCSRQYWRGLRDYQS